MKKKWFDLWCQMNWLRTIDKEIHRLERLEDKCKRKRYLIGKLWEEYAKLYPKGIGEEDTP